MMCRELAGDALCAAETVVDKALDSCESNAATRTVAPLILLPLLMKTPSPFLAPSQKERNAS